MEKKNEKQPSLLKQLFVFAGSYKYLSILSVIFAGISALIALVPFYYIWRIMQEVIRVKLDFFQAQGISSHGWHTVGTALIGMLLYIIALMCSHISALPDKAVSAVTPVGLLILMFVFDWRLGLICLIPTIAPISPSVSSRTQCSIKMLCPGWGKLAKAAALISQNRHQ